MELLYCKFWAYPNSILLLVDANFATKSSSFIFCVISLSTAANIKLSSLGWVIVVRNFDLTKVRASFPMNVTPPLYIFPRICTDLMGAQNEPRGGSAPLGPPRGYATSIFYLEFYLSPFQRNKNEAIT